MLHRVAVVGILVALVSSVAQAQPGAQPGGPAVPPDPNALVGAQIDPTAAAYDTAFAALADGKPEEAATGFDQVAATSQDPQRAASARELARLAHTLATKHARYVMGTAADQKLAAGLDEDDRDDGRTSFITFTTVFGLYTGVVLIDDLNISDYRAGILTVAATTAVGLLGSYFGSKDARITAPMGDAYGLGMIFGMANAGMLIHPLDANTSSETAQTTILLSGAVGGILGLGYASSQNPTRGQVGFASTLGILGFASTGLALVIGQPSTDGDNVLVAMAGGMDLGLAAGIVLGKDLDWSVSRGRIITLGTLLGGLAGAAGGALVLGDHPDNNDGRILAAATLVGTWGGFGLTMHLTNGMHPDRRYATTTSTTQLTALPVRNGGGLALAGTF